MMVVLPTFPERVVSSIVALFAPPVRAKASADAASRPMPVMAPPITRTCRHGHAMDDANTYHRRNGRIECRTCRAAASRRYRAKLKQKMQ